jgi:YegS/Rv2252/BmrU family lipid kinase
MKALLVANPNAGRLNGARLAAVSRLLRGMGVEVSELAGDSKEDSLAALRLALSQASLEETRVIALGGDGTVNGMLPALIGTPFPLGIVPAGTLNALAGELRIPRALEAAVAVAVNGRRRRIDVGVANGRAFAQMAGIGFDGAVVRSVVPASNKKMFSPAVLARGLRLAATYHSSRFVIKAGCETIEARAWLALVANASRYTYGICAAPGARLDDGWLDLWLFESLSPRRTLGQVLALLTGQHSGSPGILRIRAQHMGIEADPPAWVHVDGDAGGRTPMEFQVRPSSLTVMVPASPAVGWHAPGASCATRTQVREIAISVGRMIPTPGLAYR